MKYLLIFLLLFSSLYAEPLKVNPIPYVQSNLDIPHIAINGLPTHLQAIAEGGSCTSYSYKWDLNGDGDFNDTNESIKSINANTFFVPLHHEHQYPNALGNTYVYPKVEVSCGDETVSAIFPILIFVDRICDNYYNDPLNPNCSANNGNLELTRQIYSSRAVDIALWFLFRQAIHKANDSLNHNEHLCYISGNQTLYSTGMTLNAFLRRGHGFGTNKDNDPYYRHFTQCGLHSILSTMQLKNIGFTDTDVLGTQGKGMEFVATNNLNAWYWSSYESTAWAEPLANFGNSSYISPVGRDGIFNNTLKNIGQDIIDGLLQCTTSDGAWFYTCSNMTGATNDASTNGWSPEAIRILKRKFNNVDYESFKSKQRNWLSIYCPNGICAYDGPSAKLAGNTLVGYGWIENENVNSNAQVSSSINAIQSWYLNDPNHWGLYYIYASTKGLRSFTPEITYLPNGTHWANEYIDFFITGKNNTKNSIGASKQLANGSWTWAGNWLWAGSFSTNERTAVITQIIQSWLEVQPYAKATPQLISPNSLVTFDHSWSYALDPEVSITEFKWNVTDDLATEDINNNGKIDNDEIVWDFTTNNLNETFTFLYTQDVAWGDSIKQKVTLRTIDNQGRIVDDENAVSISISKFNHPPVAVSKNISTFTGITITLNADDSFDPDTNQEPYPNRPTRKDFISSIEFDTNLDGIFTAQESTYVVPNLNKASIPFKICDDGQWTDSCLDGIEKQDCSLCSYGSITLNILPNTEPPVILVSDIIDNVINLNQSFDPENLNISFSLEIVNGQGSIQEVSKGVYVYVPAGDGFRIDVLKITATDEGGLSSTKNIYIEVPNLPPIVESVIVEYRNLNPIIQSVDTINLGNGFYKINVYAIPNPNIEVKATATITDADPFITATFNNVFVIDSQPFQSPYILSNGAGIFEVLAFDGTDSSSVYVQEYSFPKANSLSYTIDIDDNSFVEVLDSSLNTFSFKANKDTTDIKITVKDNLNVSSEYTTSIDTTNHSPMIDNVNLTQNGKQILILVTAFDLDNDSLQFELNTGDNNTYTNNTGIFSHTYIYDGEFTPSIKVMDSRGLVAIENLETLSFLPNMPPVIQSITALNGYAGKCSILVEASDPNKDILSYEVQVAGLIFESLDFTLPYQASPYTALLTIKDSHGLSTSQEFEISVLDDATLINIEYHKLVDNNFIFVANVFDNDTTNLKFFWKIDDQEYIENSNIKIFDLDINLEHTITVKVLDTWSNIETEKSIRTYPAPLPVIDDVEVNIEGGGEVSLIITSNSVFLNYRVDWGDGTINNSLQHKYAWSDSPYQIKVQGFTATQQSVVYTKDIQVINHPSTIEEIQVWQDDGIITVSVFAQDIDVEDVLYSFDFENDGILESNKLWNNTKIYEAQRAGDLVVKIDVYDQWSNTYTEVIREIDVQAWLLTVDNIQSEEGRCVILSANDIENPKLNLENCNLESDITSDYLWLLENEVNKTGEEVAYLFEDDGIFTIKMISPEGFYNKIRVHVSNVAPIFTSIPDMVAYAGSVYKYDIQVKDQGSLDLVEVKLGAGSPTNMNLIQVDDFLYRLEWEVPRQLAGTEASVTLIALDYQGSDDHYTYDGGRTEQSFRIHVLNTDVKDMGIKDMMDGSIKDMLLNIDNMDKDLDQAVMYEDKTPTKNTKFQGASCQSTNTSINLFLIAFLIVIFKRLYKHIA